MKLPRLATYAVLLIISAGFLRANAQDEDTVEIQFVSYPPVAYEPSDGPLISEDTYTILAKKAPVELLISPTESINVKLTTGRISEVYKVKRMGQWILGKQAMSVEGNPTFTVYGKATATSAPRQILLVIPKGKTYADGLQISVIESSKSGFGPGKYLIYNGTNLEIAGSIGDAKYRLKPSQQTMFIPKANEVKFGAGVLYVRAFYPEAGKAKSFYSTEWALDDKARLLVFFYNDPKTQKPRMYYLRDYPRI